MSTRIYHRDQIWEFPRDQVERLEPVEYQPMKELGILLAAFTAERLGVLRITRREEYTTNAGLASSAREYNEAFHGEYEDKEIYPAGWSISADQEIFRVTKSIMVRIPPQPTCLALVKRKFIEIKTKLLSTDP